MEYESISGFSEEIPENGQFHTLQCDEEGARLDRFLASKIDNISRTRLQALINGGYVTVSGAAQKPGFKLSRGQTIRVELPPSEPLKVLPVNIPLDVIYEDVDIIVVNKPKGMVVHPAPGHLDDTLVNALLYRCEGRLSGINGVLRPGIVHRIDKDTTGLLVAAKTNEAHASLSRQLSERKMERVYQAIVHGSVSAEEGKIDAPIGRCEKDRLKMCVNHKNGKTAVTHFRALERCSYRGSSYTYIEFRLETGRTHQIRVHMAHIGHSILGDSVYSNRKPVFNADGQVLHAKTLGFSHPTTGEHMFFESELPVYFREILSKLGF